MSPARPKQVAVSPVRPAGFTAPCQPLLCGNPEAGRRTDAVTLNRRNHVLENVVIPIIDTVNAGGTGTITMDHRSTSS